VWRRTIDGGLATAPLDYKVVFPHWHRHVLGYVAIDTSLLAEAT
jgi:hypothetical protein